jgi:hypothetical protein
MGRLAACSFVLAQLVSVGAARAAPPDEEGLIQTGTELRRAGRDADALAVFARALAIRESPRAKAQVGFAHQALGRWVEAEQDLAAVLAAPGDTWTKQHRGTVESALAAVRTHLAWLDVEANVPGAELRIEGAAAGTLPLASPARVVGGTITIEVNADGFVPQRRTVQVEPGIRAREVMTLVKSLSSGPGSPDTQPHAAVPSAAAFPTPLPAQVAPDANAAMRTAAWISLATAAAFSAGAGTAMVLRESNAATYNDDRRCFYGALTRDQRCGSYRNAASTAEVLATVGLSVAAASAMTSALFFILSSRARAEPTRAAVRCTLNTGVECLMLF